MQQPLPPHRNTAILLIVCPDQAGLIAAISSFIHEHRGNIVYLDQHTDLETKTFLMRVEWELEGFTLGRLELEGALAPLIARYRMNAQLYYSDQRPRLALMVSKYKHCLYDLLVRHTLGELEVDIPLIMSNHPDLAEVAEHFRIPFVHIPISEKNKKSAELEQIQILKAHGVDLIVLARYMQIVSAEFIAHYPRAIINIHHSTLPAFIGAKPYHQAYARGVKIIGATSHYVTAELDNGPIIHQSVTPVSHLDQVDDLVRKGRDQEKLALAFAVRLHCQRRILTYHDKTVVFE